MSEEQPKREPIKTIEIRILVNLENGKIFVNGPLQNKPLVLHALADAINIVIDHDPSQILRPGLIQTQPPVPTVH